MKWVKEKLKEENDSGKSVLKSQLREGFTPEDDYVDCVLLIEAHIRIIQTIEGLKYPEVPLALLCSALTGLHQQAEEFYYSVNTITSAEHEEIARVGFVLSSDFAELLLRIRTTWPKHGGKIE